MGELKHAVSGGNPEGKGVSEFLCDRIRSAPTGVVAKPRRRLLADFFASMLVLSAKFKYRPVVGTSNYLYWINNEWSLSLIAPDEWSAERRAGFAASCVLRRDMTWAITPSDRLSVTSPVSDAIGHYFDAFVEMLDTDLTLEEILPYYVAKLPYYQRLYSSAMSRSIRASVMLGDQASSSGRQWYRLAAPAKKRITHLHGLSA